MLPPVRTILLFFVLSLCGWVLMLSVQYKPSAGEFKTFELAPVYVCLGVRNHVSHISVFHFQRPCNCLDRSMKLFSFIWHFSRFMFGFSCMLYYNIKWQGCWILVACLEFGNNQLQWRWITKNHVHWLRRSSEFSLSTLNMQRFSLLSSSLPASLDTGAG